MILQYKLAAAMFAMMNLCGYVYCRCALSVSLTFSSSVFLARLYLLKCLCRIAAHLFVVTFSSYSPLCFLHSMSSPPIWPGSPFYRKNKGVLLQGRVTCLTVFTCCDPSLSVFNVSLVPLTSALYFFTASVLLQEAILVYLHAL